MHWDVGFSENSLRGNYPPMIPAFRRRTDNKVKTKTYLDEKNHWRASRTQALTKVPSRTLKGGV